MTIGFLPRDIVEVLEIMMKGKKEKGKFSLDLGIKTATIYGSTKRLFLVSFHDESSAIVLTIKNGWNVVLKPQQTEPAKRLLPPKGGTTVVSYAYEHKMEVGAPEEPKEEPKKEEPKKEVSAALPPVSHQYGAEQFDFVDCTCNCDPDMHGMTGCLGGDVVDFCECTGHFVRRVIGVPITPLHVVRGNVDGR